jgi:hypothetical protein
MKYAELFESGSRGIFIRAQDAKLGKTVLFKNKNGEIITAIDNMIFPEEGLYYENDTIDSLPDTVKTLPPAEIKSMLKTGQQKLMDTLEQYRIATKIPKTRWHIVNNTGRAAMVTLWVNQQNQLVAYIKLFPAKRISAIPFFWSNSDFADETGFSIENANQMKHELNLKPANLIKSDNWFTPDELIEAIETNIISQPDLPSDVISQIPKLLKNVNTGFSDAVSNAAPFIKSYETDLGEVAAPIALITGHFISGAYQEVENQLLKPLGSSWNKITKCSFPISETERLIDSYLYINENVKLSISSKNRTGGSAASITSLTSAITANPERYTDIKNNKKFKYLFNVLNLIENMNAVDGALALGVIYKIISKEEQIEIKNLIKDLHATKKDISKNLQKLLSNPLYKPNTGSVNYCIGYHLLTIVAHLTCEYLNNSESIVTEFFKTILSRSNLVQVTTTMKKHNDNGLSYDNFNIIWPAIFDGNVKFNSQKNYSAQSFPGGKICFSIK